MRCFQRFSILLLILMAMPTGARDVPSGKDHPLLTRFSGSQLDGFQEIGFEKGLFYLPDSVSPAVELQMDKPVEVEGKVTRLLYLAPKGKTPLEVHRNFVQALQSANASFKTNVNGKDAAWEPAKHWRKNFTAMAFQGSWAADVSPFWRDGQYVYAVIERGGSQWHVSVLTAQNFAEQSAPQAAIAVQIVEPVPMMTGQVKLNVDALKQGLVTEGKIALYGIYFDSGKSDIKPESAPQLEQIALLMRQSASERFFIVGHTDNEGAYDANFALSLRRAEAIVNALTKQHKIDAKRLLAKGVASVAPVASNSTGSGRSRNRRVELVLQ